MGLDDQGKEIFGNIESFPDKQSEKTDYLENNLIPASLLAKYQTLSDEEKKDFKYYISLLADQGERYSNPDSNNFQRLECVKAIAIIAKTLVSKYSLVYSNILDHVVSRINRLQQTEFKGLILTHWLQLYVEDDKHEDNNEKPTISKSETKDVLTRIEDTLKATEKVTDTGTTFDGRP